VISGGVYRPPPGATEPFPAEYHGDYFFSDYYIDFLRRLKRNGATWSLAPAVPGQPGSTNWGTNFDAVSDYLVGPEGSLWYCRQAISFASNSGQIRRIRYTGAQPPPDTVNRAMPFFARPFPLPAPGYVNLSYTLPRAARVTLRIYDSKGSLVRALLDDRTQAANTYDVSWDGTDAGGRLAPPGMYFIRLEVDDDRFTHRVPMIR
jgi:hypothetical protein